MNLFKKKMPDFVKERLPHIHESYKIGPCPICGQNDWEHDQDCRNESTCKMCGLRFNYPYDYAIEEANAEKLKALGITPYGEIARKEKEARQHGK